MMALEDRTIRWVELPSEIVDLSPMEQMRQFAAASEQRPSNSPWIGMIVPMAKDSSYKEVALSLVGSVRFTDEIRRGFAEIAAALVLTCNSGETARILREQQERGNPEESWSADEGLLRIVVPARLTAEAQRQITRLAEGSAEPLQSYEE